jgi:hypothetical protein
MMNQGFVTLRLAIKQSLLQCIQHEVSTAYSGERDRRFR